MTAPEMLRRLNEAGYAPAIVDDELVLARVPQKRLADAVAVLQCPMRAIMLGRRLFAMDEHANPLGPSPMRDGVIDPRQLLPRNAALLIVEASGPWCRISPLTCVLEPNLFEPWPESAGEKKPKAPSAWNRERAK